MDFLDFILLELGNPIHRNVLVPIHLDSICMDLLMKLERRVLGRIFFYRLGEVCQYKVELSIIESRPLECLIIFLLGKFHLLEYLLKVWL